MHTVGDSREGWAGRTGKRLGGGSYGDKTRQSFRANSLDTIWDRGKSLSTIAVIVDVLMRELYERRKARAVKMSCQQAAVGLGGLTGSRSQIQPGIEREWCQGRKYS